MLGLSPEQLLGTPTVHIPINLIVQEAAGHDGKFCGVWQAAHPDVQRLLMESNKTHQLVMADAFIRPQMVCDSNEFRGDGLANIACNGFVDTDKWKPIWHRG